MKPPLWALLVLLLIATTVKAQPPHGMRGERPQGGIIMGTVVDSETQQPLEYANLFLYTQADSTYITGGVTQADGTFRLMPVKPGTYYLQISFMGFETITIPNIEIAFERGKLRRNVGEIRLHPLPVALEGVEVSGERAKIEYQIDKKVIKVSEFYTATSGSAVDVLENVPSVKVDIEGNVSLRGSENFTVLIDGRPSILDPSDALQQIPAGTIENIEIITNPSAKYNPEGTAGIINVITKKKKSSGVSGRVNLNGGWDEKYGGDVLLNYQTPKLTFNVGVDYNRRLFPGSTERENRTTGNDTTAYVRSHGDTEWERERSGIRTGISINLTPQNTVSLSGRWGDRHFQRSANTTIEEWREPGDARATYTDQSDTKRGGPFYALNLTFQHKFEKKGHELNLQTDYSHRESEEESVNALFDTHLNRIEGQVTEEEGPADRVECKLDYALPLRENEKFEAGLQARLGQSEDGTRFSEYNPLSGQYEIQPEYDHTTLYTRNVYSLYSLYANEQGNLGYQFGLRAEYTDRVTEIENETEEYRLDQWDVFPSVHFSYTLGNRQKWMASYTRRIEHPRGWYLEPFLTWSDAYNVRSGNPALKPEYIDSYEIGYQQSLEKHSISVDGYYRVTHNKIERIRTVYADNILLHLPENVGKDYALGVEIMLDLNPVKWWNINLMGDIYEYRVEGDFEGQEFSRKSSNWSSRFNNTFKFGSTRLQLNGMYNSPATSSQGEREGFFMANAAIRQNLRGNNITATLQIRDIFDTGTFETTAESTNFYSYSKFTHDSPTIMFTLTYNFNNYRPDRRDRNGNGENGGMEEGDDF
ncbi:MAG: TonB-dependent receptor [Gemmatimonadetes bacterium]|nr:MAG: TonB-dependent receptor [Gemmatimonadota bacterium]